MYKCKETKVKAQAQAKEGYKEGKEGKKNPIKCKSNEIYKKSCKVTFSASK